VTPGGNNFNDSPDNQLCHDTIYCSIMEFYTLSP